MMPRGCETSAENVATAAAAAAAGDEAEHQPPGIEPIGIICRDNMTLKAAR